MKKQVKILTIALLVITILMAIGNIVLATDTITTTIDALSKPGNVAGATKVQDLGKQIVGILQVIGVVIAIVVLLVLGIKYMMGSTEEKAEYKKVMLPYLVGALLIFAATTIVNVVYNVFSNINV